MWDDLEHDGDSVIWPPGHSFTFEAERTPAHTVADPDRTLSADAVSALMAHIGSFILSRMIRAMDRGHPPQHLTVRVSVILDGEPAK
jgi:hypothetical protein